MLACHLCGRLGVPVPSVLFVGTCEAPAGARFLVQTHATGALMATLLKPPTPTISSLSACQVHLPCSHYRTHKTGSLTKVDA